MLINSTNNISRNKLQKSGILLSVLCSIHCAALPIVLLLMPALSSGAANHLWMDAAILLTVIAIGFFTIGSDYRNKHGEKLVIFTFVTGILMLIAGHLTDIRWLEVAAAIIGGGFLAGSQFYSLKLSRRTTSIA